MASTAGCAATVSPLRVTSTSDGTLPSGNSARSWPKREKLTIDVNVIGVHAGRASLTTEASCRSGSVRLRSHGASEGLAAWFSDRALIGSGRLHRASGLPQRYTLHILEDNESARYGVVFHPGFYNWQQHEPSRELRGHRLLPGESNAHTFESAFLALRHWRPKDSQHASLLFVVGRRLYQFEATFVGRQRLEHQGREVWAVRIDGTIYKLDRYQGETQDPHAVSLWFADDEPRTPLRAVASLNPGEVELRVLSVETIRCQPASEDTAGP